MFRRDLAPIYLNLQLDRLIWELLKLNLADYSSVRNPNKAERCTGRARKITSTSPAVSPLTSACPGMVGSCAVRLPTDSRSYPRPCSPPRTPSLSWATAPATSEV